MKYLSAILLFVLALTMPVAAQQAQGGTAKVWTESFTGSSTAVVKGEPYSAEAISESVQMLADGNKITRSNTTRMFRDSEGRTRRESGPLTGGSGFANAFTTASGSGSDFFTFSGFGFQETISIFDPVSSLRYSLNPTAKTARRMQAQLTASESALAAAYSQAATRAALAKVQANSPKNSQSVVLRGLATTPVGDINTVTTLIGDKRNAAGKTESLGTRDIEGVTAEGTRSITTIPAGAIGNERPIETVYERWYSKELQLIVYSKHTDPRFGEQTYRLKNINRSEPDRSLFTPPADYKIVAEQSVNVYTARPREDK